MFYSTLPGIKPSAATFDQNTAILMIKVVHHIAKHTQLSGRTQCTEIVLFAQYINVNPKSPKVRSDLVSPCDADSVHQRVVKAII
jgi:hypothetical protein